MQITPTAAAAADFRALVTLTTPGAPVAPVISTLDHAVQQLRAAGPRLEQAHAPAQLLDAVSRAQGGAATLRNALAELRDNDGMTTFDAAFASDDTAWDATFTDWADALEHVDGNVPSRSEAPTPAPRANSAARWTWTGDAYMWNDPQHAGRTPPVVQTRVAFEAAVESATAVMARTATARAAQLRDRARSAALVAPASVDYGAWMSSTRSV